MSGIDEARAARRRHEETLAEVTLQRDEIKALTEQFTRIADALEGNAP